LRQSSERLEKRMLEIIEFWTQPNGAATKVILVTHSMGGLVARACAKRIPDKIAGVIHGVMPALGAPAAYRRMACGTESSSPDYGPLDNWSLPTGEDPGRDDREDDCRAGDFAWRARAAAEPPLSRTVAACPGHDFRGKVPIRPQARRGTNDDGRPKKLKSATTCIFPSAKYPNPYDLYRDIPRGIA
jgi:pimeloyl-ACP methyl ester carboxylesterase